MLDLHRVEAEQQNVVLVTPSAMDWTPGCAAALCSVANHRVARQRAPAGDSRQPTHKPVEITVLNGVLATKTNSVPASTDANASSHLMCSSLLHKWATVVHSIVIAAAVLLPSNLFGALTPRVRLCCSAAQTEVNCDASCYEKTDRRHGNICYGRCQWWRDCWCQRLRQFVTAEGQETSAALCSCWRRRLDFRETVGQQPVQRIPTWPSKHSG